MFLENAVLLLKSQKGEKQRDEYESLLIKNGFIVKQCKTLVFDFKHLDQLLNKLQNADLYEGIIFSSPRCVQAVNLAVEADKNILEQWQSKHNFVVGEATYKDALDKLKLVCEGKESGNSSNLCHFIVEGKNKYTKPFLYPHGNLKTDTLTKELAQHGIDLEDILVYDTVSNPDIEKEIAQVTDNFQRSPEYIVFFSPSGVKSSIDILKKLPNFDSVKLIAIGPTTELAMKEQNLKIFGVPKNPLPNDVLSLMLK